MLRLCPVRVNRASGGQRDGGHTRPQYSHQDRHRQPHRGCSIRPAPRLAGKVANGDYGPSAPGIARPLCAILVPMEHDASYKLLFSYARMVEDLLHGFVHEAWVRDLDCTSLERVSDSYISDDLRSRRDDLVWRARWGPNWFYLYLMLEFQS